MALVRSQWLKEDKTAFCMPFGLFGLCNSPSSFQRLLQRIVGNKSHYSLLLYLGDIVVFSTSFHQHLESLEMVLGRLHQHSFSGFASYYQRFIEGFAGLAAPLHGLLGKLRGSWKKPSLKIFGFF